MSQSEPYYHWLVRTAQLDSYPIVFSHAAQYAVRAVSHLASIPEDSFTPARQIAAELQIPATFLAKVLSQLVEGGLLVAHRGPTGGVRLLRAPEEITVREIIEVIDGTDVFTECVLGLPGCGDTTPCPMHAGWAGVRDALAKELSRQTIATIADAYVKDQLRLKP